MQPFFVYILKCSDSSYYIGHTDDIEKRMCEYNEKINCGAYVLKRWPVTLVLHDLCATRNEAIEVERQLKGWSRKKKEILINHGWPALKGFCKSQKTLRK